MRRRQAHLDNVQETDLISPQKSIPLLSELSNPLTLLADVLYLGCLINWNSSWYKHRLPTRIKNNLFFAWYRGRPGVTVVWQWGKSMPLSHYDIRQHWEMYLGDRIFIMFLEVLLSYIVLGVRERLSCPSCSICSACSTLLREEAHCSALTCFAAFILTAYKELYTKTESYFVTFYIWRKCICLRSTVNMRKVQLYIYLESNKHFQWKDFSSVGDKQRCKISSWYYKPKAM